MPPPAKKPPTLEQHRQRALDVFGKLPCICQARSSLAQMQGKNAIYIAGTGSGKTLTLWLPLIHDTVSTLVVLCPLLVLARQHAADLTALNAAGINAIALTASSCTTEAVQSIANGKYRAVVMVPELVHDPRTAKIWDSRRFTKCLGLAFDELHCLSTWGRSFRPAYLDCVRILWRLPPGTRVYGASATLTEAVLLDCLSILHLDRPSTVVMRRSNDRPNIRYSVRQIQYAQNTFADLAFVIPRPLDDGPFQRPPKFLIFCNEREDAEEIGDYFIRRVGVGKVVWYHSGMSDQFKAEMIAKLESGEIWGFICTDAAGLGLNVVDIMLVIQWKVPNSLDTLMQRFGRAVRDPQLEGEAILLAEPTRFWKDDDDGLAKRAAADASFPPSGSAPPPTAVPGPKPLALTETATVAGRKRSPIDPAMDAFVNAGVLKRPCRRQVSHRHYDNDNADKEDKCCLRCQPLPARICCDLCHPSSFVVPPVHPLDVPARTRSRNKTKTPPYQRGPKEHALTDALRLLRESLAAEELGDIYNADIAFLSDPLLDFFVDLAHYRALKSVSDLRIDATWVYTEKYGQKIVDLVQMHIPQSEEASAVRTAGPASSGKRLEKRPLGDITNGDASAEDISEREPPRKRRKVTVRRCGKCGSTVHIASSSKCPRYGLPSQADVVSGGPEEIPGGRSADVARTAVVPDSEASVPAHTVTTTAPVVAGSHSLSPISPSRFYH